MRTQSPDTSPEAEKVLIDLLSKAPMWRRIQLTDQMSKMTRLFAWSGVRSRHPEASDEVLNRKFAEVYLGSELAEKVYGSLKP